MRVDWSGWQNSQGDMDEAFTGMASIPSEIKHDLSR